MPVASHAATNQLAGSGPFFMRATKPIFLPGGLAHAIVSTGILSSSRIDFLVNGFATMNPGTWPKSTRSGAPEPGPNDSTSILNEIVCGTQLASNTYQKRSTGT